MTPEKKIRILIVDDSAFVRRVARDMLAADPEITVVGTAADPYEARDQITRLVPDVMTLDLEMPRMDGLTFLSLVMAQRPLPVIVMSSLTFAGSAYALEALRLGAVDVIGKPSGANSIHDDAALLVAKVKAAARARVRPAPARPIPTVAAGSRFRHPRSLILLGASTGGVTALHDVLEALPAELPPIAVVQHIPALFSKAFADRLNQACALEVREAADGEILRPGTVLIAPGGFHLLLRWCEPHYRARVVNGPAVWHQRPAVDMLFRSAAEAGAAPHCLAGVLTGMGRDGADGLLQLRDKGAATFAQDEATSVVYGMPRAAAENGAAQTILALDRISHFICHAPVAQA